MRLPIAIASAMVAILLTTGAAQAQTASASLMNADGQSVGQVGLTQTPHGVLLSASLWNLPSGTHAFHVHAVGKCEAPFKSAGGHFNPKRKKHGIARKGGMHVGDMPNVHVDANGTLTIEVLNKKLALDDALFDADGAAIVMHAGADDYKSDPAPPPGRASPVGSSNAERLRRPNNQ